jgi:hypothetical protein
MFSRLFKRAQVINNFQVRKYWIPHVEPTHDIVSTINQCQKWQLSYLVKKTYTNHANGSTILMDPKILLSCQRFLEAKKSLESENYVFYISKDRTIGANTFQVHFDEFNKKIQIIV